jgi:hypothetical protein
VCRLNDELQSVLLIEIVRGLGHTIETFFAHLVKKSRA